MVGPIMDRMVTSAAKSALSSGYGRIKDNGAFEIPPLSYQFYQDLFTDIYIKKFENRSAWLNASFETDLESSTGSKARWSVDMSLNKLSNTMTIKLQPARIPRWLESEPESVIKRFEKDAVTTVDRITNPGVIKMAKDIKVNRFQGEAKPREIIFTRSSKRSISL